MSNNSAVVVGPDGRGGEIGRAQAMQAAACGLAPDLRFNPVLLKPGSDLASQVVLLGEAVDTITAGNFRQLRPRLAETAYAALAELRDDVRRGDLRGRRQPRRDQPAGRRLRQHGAGPARRPAHHRRRRHRPGRGLRLDVRHRGPARPRRPGAGRRLRDQQVPGRPRAAPAGAGHAAPGHRPAHVRGAALGTGPLARRRGLARLRPGARPAGRPARQRMAGRGGRPPAPDQQRHRRGGARHRAGRPGTPHRRAGRAGRRRPGRPARLQVHRRRPRPGCARPASPTRCPPTRRPASRCSASAAASRCSAAPSTTRWRAAGAASPGLGLLPIEITFDPRKTVRPVGGHRAR